MKIIFRFVYIILGLGITACSGEAVEGSKGPSNKAPSAPRLISPENALACSYSPLSFEWETSTDPEGNNVSYYLEVSKDENFNDLFAQREVDTTKATLDLDKGSTYYWRVLAMDEKKKKSGYDETRSFYTEPNLAYNSIPQTPHSETPVNNSSINEFSVSLGWESQDADGDSIKYDLYFGTDNPPSLIKENLIQTSLDVELELNTTYFWQVVAKDDKGAKAIGPVWTFNTI
ncbi:hypothetical protein [Christiangramia aquimixticola]|uniref:hypothetical protein n=1 Tax=Christiangramia aquimixticola TaxID=1697558 RepID=UPI003AA92852